MATPQINIPDNLAQYLATFGTKTVLSDTLPAAPGGSTNITWSTDEFGNISASVAAGGGGNTFGTADYNVTNLDEFYFPNPVVIQANAAVGPTVISDTGGEGGFVVQTDSNSGGIGLVATGFSGITLDSQANISIASGGTSQVQISAGSNVAISSPTVFTASTTTVPLAVEIAFNATADAAQFQNHLGNPISRVNHVGDFCLSNTVGQPSDAPVAGATRFDSAASKLWIYNGTAWVGTVLS